MRRACGTGALAARAAPVTRTDEQVERWSRAALVANRRLIEDLELWCDRSLGTGQGQTFASGAPAVGQEQIHVALRFELMDGALVGQGAWLIPWPEAARLVGWFEGGGAKRCAELLEAPAPDATAKVTLLEVGGVVAAAVEASLSDLGLVGAV